MSTLSLKATITRKAGHAADSPSLTPADSMWTPAEKTQSRTLQNPFLDSLLGKVITVYLISGIRLVGTLTQHDMYTLRLEGSEGVESLLFKSGVATVVSSPQPGSLRLRR